MMAQAAARPAAIHRRRAFHGDFGKRRSIATPAFGGVLVA
jgi:hypothetical protein